MSARIDELLRRADELESVRTRRADQALPLYREAARLAARAGDREREARAWIGLGAAHIQLHAYAEARAALERGRKLARAEANPRTEARAIQLLGNIDLERGEYEAAEALYRDLFVLGERLADNAMQVRALNNLCASARRQGHMAKAIEIGRRALAALDRSVPDSLPSALYFSVPYNLGRSLIEAGESASGLALLQRAFDGAEGTSNLGGMWHVLQDSAEWYRDHGELAKAARYFERALAKAREMESRDPEALTSRGLGALAETRGDLLDALNKYEASSSIFETIGMSSELPETLIALSRVQHQLSRRQAASSNLSRAEALARRPELPRVQTLGLMEKARQREEEGQREAAARAYGTAAQLARASGLRFLLPKALLGLARLSAAERDLERAYRRYLEAADAVEAVRSRMPSIEDRAAFAAASHSVYDGLLAVAMEGYRSQPSARNAREALLCLQRERAQASRRALWALEPDADTPWLERPDRETSLHAEVASLQLQLAVPQLSARHRTELLARLDDAERALDALEDTGLPAPAGLSLSDLDRWQRVLTADEALVAYAIGSFGAIAFVLGRETFGLLELEHVDHLESRIELFTNRLRSANSEEALPVGRLLARALVAPVLSMLPARTRRLIVAASGELAGLPFAALPDPHVTNQPLVHRLEFAYVPSLAALASLRYRRPSASVRVLAVGHPMETPDSVLGGHRLGPLPESRAEVDRLRRTLAPRATEVLTEKGASEAAVKQALLGGFGVVHFATHAFADSREPARSGLLLGRSPGEDGWLQPREIYRLRLATELVVLSACRSAGGRASAAEGLHSLARAFTHAGARAVLGTLFEVDDRAAAELIHAFYSAMLEGDTAAGALRRAQLAVAGERPYSRAAEWAAFVLGGDPVARPALAPAPHSLPEAAVAGLAALATVAGVVGAAWMRRRRSRRP